MARTRKVGILAVFALGVCVLASAQTTLLDQGRAAMQRGDYETAANLFEKAVAQNPNSSDAHEHLAEAYGSLAQRANIFKQPSLASKTHREFAHAVELDPNNLDARWGLIEFFMIAPGIMGGDEKKAVQEANEIKKRDAMRGHQAFAFIYGRQKKPDLARKEYVDAVREEPNSPKSHYLLAISFLLADKNYKSAAEEFEMAVKLDPTFMPGWFQIGHMAALSGANLQRGEEALQKYLAYTPKQDEPQHYRAYFWLGGIYERQGKRAEARQSYATSLRINPRQPDVAEALKKIS
ncbi:MAG TPA: tetratricopeptide repeat protein [Thermoanaerobaculia bacterium]|nr:tetratricopeptide repeat protein [Thermoanaerobaculia bacterium]